MPNFDSLSHWSSITYSMLEKIPSTEDSERRVTISIDSTDQTPCRKEKRDDKNSSDTQQKEREREKNQKERRSKKNQDKRRVAIEGRIEQNQSAAGLAGQKFEVRDSLPHHQPKAIRADRIECQLSKTQLERIRRVYHIPESIELVLPPPGWKASNLPKGY